jgi:hypothetical protein
MYMNRGRHIDLPYLGRIYLTKSRIGVTVFWKRHRGALSVQDFLMNELPGAGMSQVKNF